jgi:hypothetical protein
VDPPVAATVITYEPAERVPGFGTLGSITPLPQPLRPRRPTVKNAKRRMRPLQRRRRGTRKKTKQDRATAIRGGNVKVRGRPESLLAWRTVVAGEMVRTVVTEEPFGVIEDGEKTQTAPEGRPPLQEKMMVEWKLPDGVAVSVMGLEILPETAVAEAVEGERVNPPTGSRMLRVAVSDVLA